ncbi:hypothetical protein AgCh_031961 [Apium graveolens]
MVVTGHWIDKEWKLNSRIINFVNVPPPHSGHVLAEALFSCFGQWGIKDKIGTITVDNAKANDVAIKNLKESFSIRKPLRLGGNLFHVCKLGCKISRLRTRDRRLGKSGKYVQEIRRVKQVIDEKVCDRNDYISEMAEAMKEKFEKYWGESNLVMSIGAVMDPRFKMALPKFSFATLYTKEGESAKKLKYLRDVLSEIYQYYVAEDSMLKGMNSQESNQILSEKIGSSEIGNLAGVSEFESFLMSSGTNMEPVKSELDDYLSEKVLMLGDSHKSFDIISWWKANSPKYPILSQMEHDVLAIPVSTAASESSFSA